MKKLTITSILCLLVIFVFFVIVAISTPTKVEASNPEQLVVIYKMKDGGIQYIIIKDSTRRRYLVVYTSTGLAITRMDN